MALQFHSGGTGFRLLRKMGSWVLLTNAWIWRRLAPALQASRSGRTYGRFIHALVMAKGWRYPNPGTYLLRNRPELELIHDIAKHLPDGARFRIAVLGCSIGMEVYSICWQLRDLAHRISIRIVGSDINSGSIDAAREGSYSLPEHAWMLARLRDDERCEILEFDEGVARIRPQFRHGIEWRVVDACSPDLPELLGQQDLVVANRFLCHMHPERAGACLRNITRLVAPSGYLFVSGVDLSVRQSVLRDSGLAPVTDRLAEIHEGDPSLREGWPLETWGLEPLNTKREDWVIRYAMVYRNPIELESEPT